MFALAATIVPSFAPLRSSPRLLAARSSRLVCSMIGMRGGASGTVVVPIGQAKAGRVDVGDGVSLWYREWGGVLATC